MFRSVMVPLDGSPLAARALDFAMEIVRPAPAELHLVTVRRDVAELDAGRKGVEHLYLERLAGLVGQRTDLPVKTALLTDMIADRPVGDPPALAIAEMLEDYVIEHEIDLTVMTTHGRGGMTSMFMGSVAETFTRFSPSPVLVFKPAAPGTFIQHLLVLLDGSPEAELIVGPAVDLAGQLGARCTLLRIVTDKDNSDDALPYLSRIRERFTAAGIEAQVQVRRSKVPAATILAYCATNDVDALALTTRTRNPLKRALSRQRCR